MKKIIIAACVLLASCAQAPKSAYNDKIRAFDQQMLDDTKAKIEDGTFEHNQAYASFLKGADALLELPLVSVMDKPMTPPSGDKHDYTSMGPYWWPNPDTEDGLPYIRKDGVVNEDARNLDNKAMRILKESIVDLAVAYYISGEDKYAKKISEMVYTWYINPETRMNPNMNFGQIVPGLHNNGRDIGMIEFFDVIYTIDAITMIQNSPYYTAEMHAGLKQWHKEFCDWWMNSKNGKGEAVRTNNHGTAYDASLLAISLFADEQETAKQVASNFNANRLFPQLDAEGKMEHELNRTKGLTYTLFNIRIALATYRMAKTMGIDLFNSQSEDGRSLSKAIDYISQYLGKPQEEFPYQQISHWEDEQVQLARMMILADYYYPEKGFYEKVVNSGIDLPADDYIFISGVYTHTREDK